MNITIPTPNESVTDINVGRRENITFPTDIHIRTIQSIFKIIYSDLFYLLFQYQKVSLSLTFCKRRKND